MFIAITDHKAYRRRRFRLTEVLLVAAILAFSAFTLVNDGRQTFGTLLSGVEEAIRG